MSGEGGVLTTNDERMALDAKSFRQHGMSGNYEYSELGYNYRMTDVLGAIALAQLVKTDKFNETRARNANLLSEGLKDIPGIQLPTIAEGRRMVFHQYTIRVTEEFGMSRNGLMSKLKEKSIITGVYYPKPLHLYPHIAKSGFAPGDFPVAEKAAEEVLSLPVHPGLTEEQIEYIAESVKELSHA
jgi:perosamine synthetase